MPRSRRFVGDLVWSDATSWTPSRPDYSFINSDLAAVYKMTPPARDFDRVEFPADSERAGLLGQTLFLTLTSKPDDTAPTGRGLFVREQFLCQQVPPPPPGVDTNLPPWKKQSRDEPRTRLATRRQSRPVRSCHSLIDPIGFGLEKFDAIGMRREQHKLLFLSGVTAARLPAREAEGSATRYRYEWIPRRCTGFEVQQSPPTRGAAGENARSARSASSSRCSATWRPPGYAGGPAVAGLSPRPISAVPSSDSRI
jgi:hypothetical protein